MSLRLVGSSVSRPWARASKPPASRWKLALSATSPAKACSAPRPSWGSDRMRRGSWFSSREPLPRALRFPRLCPLAPTRCSRSGVTPNRPDALGHIGLARDIAAIFKLPFERKAPSAPVRIGKGTIHERCSVEVRDFERCPHYGGLVVEGVKVGPSPLWLRCRLTSLGVRPVSNIVDITNLLMLEFGHPMHAFDLDLLRGPKIVVRRAAEGERMKTLDGVDRALQTDDLLICDAEVPVALGGVMGGENTEIRASTKRVLFESACFEPRGIRRTSRRHGLHTESSHRFERGVDPSDVSDALAQAGSLATELAGAEAIPGTIHAKAPDPAPRRVMLRHSRIEKLLGVSVDFSEAKGILLRLGFEVTDLPDGEGRALDVIVPAHRPDVSREADLIEEVARIRGLDVIPTVIPAIRPQAPRDTLKMETAVRRAAVELGLSEALTYGFLSPEELEAVGAQPAVVKVLNPLTDDRTVMRTSLLPGLLGVAAKAKRRGERNARLYAIGARFLPGKEGELLPEERLSFAALITGYRDTYLARPGEVDFFDAKAVAEQLIARVTKRDDAAFEPIPAESAPKHLHPKASARVMVHGKPAAVLGMLHPEVAEHFDVLPATAVVEVDLALLREAGVKVPAYRPIPRLPAATRDIALVVPDATPAGELERAIAEAAGELCESVEIFDVFRGGNLPPAHRSIAFHVVYRDPKAASDPEHARTLTDEEVDRAHARVVEMARERLGARLR